MYKIEAYIKVPEQDVTDGYGFATGVKVAAFDACNRREIEADSIDHALAIALVQAMEQWSEQTAQANKFSLHVCPKNGSPNWKLEVDRTW